ncbi:MAG: DUF952 domain-containing protein [Spirochaetota bacterium]
MSHRSTAIYHIAERSHWEADSGAYTPPGYASEGFVHCSTWVQLPGVARALFAGREDLVVLEIDPAALAAPVVFEDLYDAGDEFPHVYGAVRREAVRAVLELRWPLPGEPAIVRASSNKLSSQDLLH